MTQQVPSSGLLIIDKPQGVTSHDVVAAARGLCHTKKVGHAGTLDPMATGVLVIGFGHATRLLNMIVEHHKTYAATIRFGQSTTTDDADGEIVFRAESADSLPQHDALAQVIREQFMGSIMQVPNTYSAIKVDGKRAYDIMRSGGEVHLDARPVTITQFDIEQMRGLTLDDGTAVVDVDVVVSCSAGTYIRALARDLGEVFHCGAHLITLRRLAVGAFRADDPHCIQAHAQQRTFTNREGEVITRTKAVIDLSYDNLAPYVISMLDAVRAVMPVVEITDEQARDLRFGRRIRGAVSERSAAVCKGEVVAIIERANNAWSKPAIVFSI